MKMTKALLITGIVLVLGSGVLSAQSFSCDGGVPLAIPDDAYDGTLGTMACCTITAADFGMGTTISDVDVLVEADHTWVGDLTIKVQSPAATVVTVMSRPGLAEPGDDGTSCCGDADDWLAPDAILYDDEDAGGVSAEDMGAPGGPICTGGGGGGDNVCAHVPFPDTGPGTNLSDFDTEDLTGAWMVCLGDSGGGDVGNLTNATLTFGAVPVELQSFSIE